MLGQLLLDKYRVTRQLDEGGMSKIYLARQDNPGRDVVVKVLKEALRQQAKSVEHFRREIHILSRFKHPNSVEVYDAQTKGPHGALLVMEYLRGVDLNQLLQRETRLTPERVGRLLGQLCDALEAAHEQGVIHRDLKPGNLMVLYPGTPTETLKVMDYGLAKMSSMLYISPDDLVSFDLPPASGTPEYISPEMVRGIDMDGRGDLYSVGVILYELLTGRRPFFQPSVEGLMIAHAQEAPPSFAEAGCRDVPAAVEAVVRGCLEKHPERRPKTAWELATSYERALGRRVLAARGSSQAGPRPASASDSGRLPGPAAPAAVDRNTYRHSLEATMPEAMAMLKLKGFVFDLGGEVLESVPGMIKVRVVDQAVEKRKGTLLGWTSGLGGRPAAVATKGFGADLELHMERLDPSQANKLTITLVMRPAGGGVATPEWHDRCARISRDLQSYLMGR
ncbi:MAG: serine/threonine-protein kinase [Gemmataceae bacterium]